MNHAYRGGLVGLLGLLIGAGAAHAQALVPLGDEVAEPLVPAWISRADVEMFGELVYLWTDADGANVAHFVGDFELQLGRRRLDAREGIVWMTRRTHDNTPYVHFEIVLWRDAQVVDSAGTVTRGPALFVTLNASGKVLTSADQTTSAPARDTTVFDRAAKIRSVIAERGGQALADSEMTVIDLSRRVQTPEQQVEPPISYQGDDLAIEEVDGQSVIVAMGHVYVFRGPRTVNDEIEIRADAAVVFLANEAEDAGSNGAEVAPGEERPGRVRLDEQGAEAPKPNIGGATLDTGGRVEGVYLEGDIVLTSGDRMVRASRLYYDFAHDRALILDAVVRLFAPDRDLPIYIRAGMVRQLSAREFTAHNALITTSEFYTPHYHVGATDLTVTDRREVNPIAPSTSAGLAGTMTMRNTTFNIGNVPILYWPFVRADIDTTETSLQSVRSGYSDNFGFELETRWALFNVLGLAKPNGVDGSLLIDYYSERGPAVGANLDYETDHAFGLFRGYYIDDNGEDDLNGRYRDEEPDSSNRGRLTWRHREYLPDDWQLTFELSYISDKNFLEEYFQSEHFNAKDQESLIYLKKQVHNWAFTAHLQYQLMEFERTTERLPDLSFRLYGQPIGDFGTFFTENRAGFVRLRPADYGLIRNLQLHESQVGSGTVARAETRNEVEAPLSIGDLRLVPFGAIRAGAWDDSPEGGGIERLMGLYGVRGSMYAWRTYPDAASELFDIHGIRHIVKADVVAWAAHGNRSSRELYEFDENAEGVDEVDGVSVGLRQRWQTKRGAPGEERIVDLLTFDLEVGAFSDAERDEYTNGYTSPTRPENSISRNYLNANAVYRINDTTELVSEANYDINDGELDNFALTYGVERTPRLSYLVGYRYVGEVDSNLLAAGLNYRISEKYLVAVREEFDLDRGETAEFDIGVIRKFPRWYVSVTFALDEVQDDFSVSLSAWPEGLPTAAIGSRRFTGLVTTTGIRPGS
ncbi:MAG TPA: LPS assembly protein LptD [Phycisphaerae bacterium]|nr:LPS assembly protein LptD [Phycisphaerae bacterium]